MIKNYRAIPEVVLRSSGFGISNLARWLSAFPPKVYQWFRGTKSPMPSPSTPSFQYSSKPGVIEE
ncbi:hypothetical protein [uncultured Pedobacter sp.]|uniref:hypothetical protein n=1 Tax=uncultured Pedobacter sp. TaxID=246139 RepID=UPI0025F6A79E|nr:hypothetical protein [uncultured Pedobacter sp.]